MPQSSGYGKRILMMLSKRPASEFKNFCVSDAVLNGLVSVNQCLLNGRQRRFLACI